jgi:hypothetical protein
LHLQLLGNPIANDSCYGGQPFYGTSSARVQQALHALQTLSALGISHASHSHLPALQHLEQQQRQQLRRKDAGTLDPSSHMSGSAALLPHDTTEAPVAETVNTRKTTLTDLLAIAATAKRADNESLEQFLQRTCKHCLAEELTNATLPQKIGNDMHCDNIWLHALRYECPEHWQFTTDMPDWALHFACEHPFKQNFEEGKERTGLALAALSGESHRV